MGIDHRYQKRFADLLNHKYAFSFWKGRVAFYAVLKALGVETGDEVIMPGYTCVMNVNPVKYLGARPVFVDIESQTYNINNKFVESKITSKTKVILVQHTYGFPCDMDYLVDVSKRYNLLLIEDCCLAFGSTYKGRLVGSFGKAAYFSFQWNKPFTTGLGGMLVTSDNDLAKRIIDLRTSEMIQPSINEIVLLGLELMVYRLFIYPRTTALAQQLFRFLSKKGVAIGSSSSSEYEPVMDSDFLKGMSRMQSFSGIGQIGKIQKNMMHRRKMADLYDKLLTECGFRVNVYDKKVKDPVLVRYPVRIKEKKKALIQAIDFGMELGSWFECPLHPIETPLDKYDYSPGSCPEAEKASKEVVNLPLHPRTSEKTIHRTVKFLSSFIPA